MPLAPEKIAVAKHLCWYLESKFPLGGAGILATSGTENPTDSSWPRVWHRVMFTRYLAATASGTR